MAVPADRHVIMLDRWLEALPDQWPVTASFASLEAARDEDGHAGRNPSPLPRAAYRAELVERVRLLDQRTGRRETAGIYRLERRTDV